MRRALPYKSLGEGTEGEKRAVVAAYLDRVVLCRGSEPLAARVLLLLRGEERAFEPLPGRGRIVALQAWPEFPRSENAGVALAQASQKTG